MSDAPLVLALDAKKHDRYSKLVETFKERFGSFPDFVARAPGRVNLIGEHIDYCGYSVLPMAVEQDICAAVKTTDSGEIRLKNVDASVFKDFSTSVENIVIDNANPQWFNYFLCGVKGLLEHEKLQRSTGMDVLIHGIVPKNAGLSSSSALVCVAGLATGYANEKLLTKKPIDFESQFKVKIYADDYGYMVADKLRDLNFAMLYIYKQYNDLKFAEMCAKCEHYIGTQGGGMDQSISFLAESGSAKLISFNPLRTEEVNLPEGACFVISNSCVELNKAATSHFNQRVAECKIATQVLAKLNKVDGMMVKTFSQLQQKLNFSFEKMLDLVSSQLHEEPYSRSEVLKILEITDEQLVERCLSQNTLKADSFKLHQRASHVFSEAHRVLTFKETCDSSSSDNKQEMLGDLMNRSHLSCSKSYECSCEELDKLTEMCRDSGALGSRLTGAGWGGCAVSLVPSTKLENFMSSLKSGYYDNLGSSLKGRQIEEVLFATKPGPGAAVYLVQK